MAGTYLDQVEAVLARLGGFVVVSHVSAACLWGLDLPSPPEVVDACVPRNRSRAAAPGALVRRRSVPLSDVALLGPRRVPVTSLARTAVDLLEVLPFLALVVAMDSILRRRDVTAAEICAVARRLRRLSRLVAVLAASDAHSGSALESMLRVLLLAAGLRPLTQYSVRDDGRVIAYVDFAWPVQRVIVEADGYAYHRERADYLADRERARHFARLGYVLLRYGWEDVTQRPDEVVNEIVTVLRGRGMVI